MAQYGIQWDANALSGVGQVSWIITTPPFKYLIKQNSQYYSIKPEFYQDGQFTPLVLSGGDKPNDDDYNNQGFDDVNILCTDMTIGEETFKPIDKVDNQFQIKKYVPNS